MSSSFTGARTDSAILDPATLARLRQLEAFKPGIITKLVESFIGNQSRFLDDAPALAEGGDFENLRIRVHALKGAAASLGALRLAAIAHEVELAARDDPATAQARLPVLREEFTHACGALSAWAGHSGDS